LQARREKKKKKKAKKNSEADRGLIFCLFYDNLFISASAPIKK
jgi:hypothetical protein